jgi:prophage regulatory protein
MTTSRAARPATAPRKRGTAAPSPPVKRDVDHSLADRLLPLSAVKELAGIGKTMIYRKMREGTFPKCCKPGGASSRWSEREVVAWKEAVMAARGVTTEPPMPVEEVASPALASRTKAMDLTTGSGGWSNPSVPYFRLFMPYLLKRISVAGKRHAFLPLNRDYLPIGERDENAVPYARYMPSHGVYFARDPSKFAGIFWKIEGDHLWLYDDSPASRVTYFSRLEMLMTQRMEMVA